MPIHVAIDGPAGAGKSTIAKAIAKRLNIPYLDTGAMYRTLALYAINCGIDPLDAQGVKSILPRANITVGYEHEVQHMFINGEDVTAHIRTPQVSRGASDIGVHPAVRQKLVELQQAVARAGSVVMDGRDIGAIVMPHAKYKFFITASAHIRAKRRLEEMRGKGEALPAIEEMERQIKARDHTDTTRACNPLRQVEDAILIDTSSLSIEESIQSVLRHIRE